MNHKNKINSISVLCFLILFSTSCFLYSFVFAQEADPNAVAQLRQQKEAELKQLESQIDSLSSDINDLERQATTLQRDIAIYDAQIAKAELEIKVRDLSIANLADDIQQRIKLINDLLLKLDDEKNSLAELLRRQNELDSIPLIEIVLGYDKLSDFFADINNFESIQAAIQVSFERIEQSKTTAEREKEELQNQKSEEMELRNLQVLEKQREEQAKADKNNLLKSTQGQEKEYQKILAQRQKDAATIRSQLFILAGSPAIPFEKALEYANAVSKITGVRPAFLLGVIKVESELGANLGSGNWKTSMYDCYRRLGYITSAEKQKTAFLAITAALGLDPDLMPVSAMPKYGCGGAMGPAQFMPTTWMLYSDRIANITGHNPPSPWDPLDAFAAAGLLLKDNGGAAGGYTAERTAALKYFAGSNWNNRNYRFYYDGPDYVKDWTDKYQQQIDILSGS
jgi:membrane-bound lytic murein transglycosylase B